MYVKKFATTWKLNWALFAKFCHQHLKPLITQSAKQVIDKILCAEGNVCRCTATKIFCFKADYFDISCMGASECFGVHKPAKSYDCPQHFANWLIAGHSWTFNLQFLSYFISRNDVDWQPFDDSNMNCVRFRYVCNYTW